MRASITPATMTLSFFTLTSMLPKEIKARMHDSSHFLIYTIISCSAILPGALIGLAIRYRTKKNDPPDWLRILYSILSFVISICWVKFTSDNIVEIIQLFNYITGLPKTFLGMTILAWGNSLGDTAADVELTKKGLGEMAVTGTQAGAVFNVLIGLGLGLTLKFMTSEATYVDFTIWKVTDGTLNENAILPMGLIICQLLVCFVILIGAIIKDYHIDIKTTYIQSVVYACCVVFLCIYVFLNLKALS